MFFTILLFLYYITLCWESSALAGACGMAWMQPFDNTSWSRLCIWKPP